MVLAIPASKDRVIKSPKLAAIGVATLSGLTLYLLDNKITNTMITPRKNEAKEAVIKLLVHKRSPCFISIVPSVTKLKHIAASEARNPTTKA